VPPIETAPGEGFSSLKDLLKKAQTDAPKPVTDPVPKQEARSGSNAPAMHQAKPESKPASSAPATQGVSHAPRPQHGAANAKIATPQNINALKAALAHAAPKPVHEGVPASHNKQSERPHAAAAAPHERRDERPKPAEIPEAELKKVLEL
jgi:hypothetical protein